MVPVKKGQIRIEFYTYNIYVRKTAAIFILLKKISSENFVYKQGEELKL